MEYKKIKNIKQNKDGTEKYIPLKESDPTGNPYFPICKYYDLITLEKNRNQCT